MSNPVTCKITGLDELQAKLEAVDEAVSKKGMRVALREGGKIIKEQMENRAPDRTGFMRRHFGTRTSMRGKGELAGSVFVGPDKANYPKDMGERMLKETFNLSKKQQRILFKGKGRISVLSVCRFLEFGTSKMSAKPFLVASFKSVMTKALDAVIKNLKEALNEAS